MSREPGKNFSVFYNTLYLVYNFQVPFGNTVYGWVKCQKEKGKVSGVLKK